jgi:hypothetical protein
LAKVLGFVKDSFLVVWQTLCRRGTRLKTANQVDYLVISGQVEIKDDRLD